MDYREEGRKEGLDDPFVKALEGAGIFYNLRFPPGPVKDEYQRRASNALFVMNAAYNSDTADLFPGISNRKLFIRAMHEFNLAMGFVSD